MVFRRDDPPPAVEAHGKATEVRLPVFKALVLGASHAALRIESRRPMRRFEVGPMESVSTLSAVNANDLIAILRERHDGWKGVKGLAWAGNVCSIYFVDEARRDRFGFPVNQTYNIAYQNNILPLTIIREYNQVAYFYIESRTDNWITDFNKCRDDWSEENNIHIDRVFFVQKVLYWAMPSDDRSQQLAADREVFLHGHRTQALAVDARTIPLICYNCQNHGHFQRACLEPRRCRKCGGPHHHNHCVSLVMRCCHCGGPHMSDDPGCQDEAVQTYVRSLREKGQETPSWLINRLCESFAHKPNDLTAYNDYDDDGCYDNNFSDNPLFEDDEPHAPASTGPPSDRDAAAAAHDSSRRHRPRNTPSLSPDDERSRPPVPSAPRRTTPQPNWSTSPALSATDLAQGEDPRALAPSSPISELRGSAQERGWPSDTMAISPAPSTADLIQGGDPRSPAPASPVVSSTDLDENTIIVGFTTEAAQNQGSVDTTAAPSRSGRVATGGYSGHSAEHLRYLLDRGRLGFDRPERSTDKSIVRTSVATTKEQGPDGRMHRVLDVGSGPQSTGDTDQPPHLIIGEHDPRGYLIEHRITELTRGKDHDFEKATQFRQPHRYFCRGDDPMHSFLNGLSPDAYMPKGGGGKVLIETEKGMEKVNPFDPFKRKTPWKSSRTAPDQPATARP
ncbi:hypothetical protein CkaCkLH20_11184 [Colletotrichum karsti]|uniref:CCHC-type domain-containing protein n=1 Tax=Colletotrichum karsti TaxID=1095194 RepID=A0A9P6HUY9_9PEZI|nr:uncharacterized protein CkaCkLH20_11184 [Colletotrichum karsti]KAF9871263.1 hypothetical protein CkaCkLH20_11184 [Colletotrichum karsti]